MAESMSPFDIASHINEKKGVLDVEEIGYNAYVINKVLSNTIDSVLFANEMNRYWSVPTQQQFDFFYHGLPKKKRYGKWHKNQDDTASLDLIQEYYGYSRKRAKDVLGILRPYLDDIRQELEKGGRNVTKQKAGIA